MALGRMYTAAFSSAETAVQDLFEVLSATDSVTVVHSITIGQSSDAGDSEAEMLRVQISRTDGTSSGSVGSTATARPHNSGDAAFGGTIEYSNTTQATNTTVIREDAFNIQAGYFYVPTPDERLVISPGDTLVVELPAAPTDSVTFACTVVLEEIGG